jgi:hypothetical protein
MSPKIQLAAVVLMLLVPFRVAVGQTVVNFDGVGGQPGNGETDFSFGGANFTGGQVQTLGLPAFYSSGSFSYHVVLAPGDTDDVVITFDQPVDSVTFFFVHGGLILPGTARAFDGGNNEIGSAGSLQTTFFNDPANFVTIDPTAPITKLTIDEATIDDFAFTALPPAPTLPAWGVIAMALGLGAAGFLLWRRAALPAR